YDKRFVAFADTCAKAGFHVVAPDLEEFRGFRITNKSIEFLRLMIDGLPRYLPEDTLKHIGMLGISYGAGPVFLLATERKFDFIVSIGGYYNLLHALEFSFTGKHPGGKQRTAHEWGRLIFALNHIEELAGPVDAQIMRSSLSLRLELKVDEAKALEKGLTDDAKYLLDGIVQGLSEDQRNTFIDITQRRRTEAVALSPESVLSEIDRETRIYLLHGTHDNSIPYEETIELQRTLKASGSKSRCLITPALTHVDFTKVGEIWELVKLLHWQRLLLSER
ncbi:MAG TPA: prolyl oligopeptidase family serine peptidase, partial [Anaerolineales bacterium]|nr:prolyl oligopeptidase family serine peptidase [Anaerolineales bacterium]